MALTKLQQIQREGKLTASRVACLMTGDKDRILNLWRELVGDPNFVEENLDDDWAVQLGSHTESLNLSWFEKKHGPVTRHGQVIVDGWRACTLDGWAVEYNCPIECKHVGGFEKLETLVARYMPQMHWQMLLTEAAQCALSVIQGAKEPIVEFVPFNQDYAAELALRANQFMEYVRTLTPPFEMEPVAPPVQAIKEYDMAGNNMWANAAGQWLANRLAAKSYDDAEKELKGMLPADGKRAYGYLLEARRDRSGRVRIVEIKK